MSSLMMVSSVSLLVPTTMSPLDPSDNAPEAVGNDILIVSRSTAIILLALFIVYLYFQLKTHGYLFLDPSDTPGTPSQESINRLAPEEMQRATLSPWAALGVLIATTCCTIWCASYLINSINGSAMSLNISRTFIGLVLIPTMGNIAKFATSIGTKIDLTIRAIIGSALQITLLIAPSLVLLGWIIDIDPPMILKFDVFEAAVFLLTIMVVNYIIQDGKTNYFSGFMLMGT
jgi:Ca2+:H+ antiporter